MFALNPGRHRVYTAIVGTVGSLLLAACSNGGTQQGAAHSPSPSPSARATDPEATFTAAYGSYDNRLTLDKAREVKIARCMKLHGFAYRPTMISREGEALGRETWGGQFRMDLTNDDLDKSRREGYGFYRLADEQATTKKTKAASVNSPPPGRQKAWDKAMLGDGDFSEATIPGIAKVGFPAEGCVGEAHKELYGDLQTYARASGVMNGLGIPLKERWQKDPQVLATDGPWRQCMRSKGFSFKNREDARIAADKIYGDKSVSHRRPHPKEIRIATADAECNVQTGKSRIERDRFAYYQQQVIKEWAPEIGRYKQIREAALPKARAILSQ